MSDRVYCHLCSAPAPLQIRNPDNSCYELWYDGGSFNYDLPEILVVFYESAKHAPAYNETAFAFCKKCIKDPLAFDDVWAWADGMYYRVELFTKETLDDMIDCAVEDDRDAMLVELSVERYTCSLTSLASAFGIEIQLHRGDGES
jgi:hypothetical protein